MRLSSRYDGVEFRLRRATATVRILPDFLIIGAQKAGTTSLYRHLTGHPDICPAFEKEVRFFNNHFDRGENWYRAHFPTRPYRACLSALRRRPVITGEGEPSYIANPVVPRRVLELIPDVKLIVMLRNPVDRAYSHFQHRANRGRESRTFEEVVAADKEVLKDGWDALPLGDAKRLGELHYSYLARGLYFPQIRNWMEVFDRRQFLVIRAEDFFGGTQKIYDGVCNFLGIPEYELPASERHNVGKYDQPMSDALRADLTEFFRPYNKRLESYLDRKFDWDR